MDITSKNLTQNPTISADILTSVVNRIAAKKDEPDVEEKFKVIPFFITESDEKKFTIKEAGGNALYVVRHDASHGWFEDHLRKCRFAKTVIFMIKEKNFNLPEDGKVLALNKKCALILPWHENTTLFGTGDDNFATSIGSYCYFLSFRLQSGFDKDYYSGLADVLLNVYSDFSPDKPYSDSRSKKISDLAKAVGYEVPANYAPGQGVEKKKA